MSALHRFRFSRFTRILATTLAGALMLFTGLLSTGALASFRLIPIEMDMEPSGRGATQIFRVENDGKDPVAIDVKVMARGMDQDGQDVLTDAEDSFAIVPEQIILQPGENQSIRVQWSGDPKPAKELPFRLVAEQLPIDLGGTPVQGGQVKLLVKYVASLYVVPEGAKPKLTVVSAGPKPATAPATGTVMEVVVRNDGTSRQVMRDLEVTAQVNGKTVTLRKEQLTGMVGENVLAGVTRRFHIPWPADLPQGPATVTLSVP
ncbi:MULTISPECIES: fimbrial biogenesis chaperone [Nitrospirillum]|uniref:Fimbrial chaperone protein n=1 Tax=Nitrospirillum amazonense TaxID=28077 RepID=A0A560FW36_9PROT|nr:fimbria/pilus periplasmic chaperone [Nitrospirillum amazonense]MEC4593871.1 fimbria/pilus periplasmic chaperone [Nitrospirillum amazonense]TWB25802.1 fimbrial chaperone protein [Nitrospirillum amazonense]